MVKRAGLKPQLSSSYTAVLKKSKSSDIIKQLAKARRQNVGKKKKSKKIDYMGV